MADFKKHLKVGAIVGAVTGAGLYLFQYYQEKERNLNHKFCWGNFIGTSLAGCAIGAIAGIAADKVEPPLNPNHRGFFHSYTFWILSSAVIFYICGDKKNEAILKNLSLIGFAGYSSHLILDMTTPKSLPILGV